MTPVWFINRLRSMDAREIGHRIVETALERLHAMGVGGARPSSPGPAAGRPWSETLPRHFDVDRYRRAADRMLTGDFSIFALRSCNLGFPPDWNRDPKSGIRAPLSFGRSINYRDEATVGNIKYLWEPNRHLEIVTVAQAWHLTRQRKYADGCRVLIESWIEQCPYPCGVNWASGLELGIRLVNWSFSWHLLGGENGLVFEGEAGARFKHRWLKCIYQHCHYLAKYPSLYSSANNHLLGEQLGLLVASLTWPKWSESARWAEVSSRTFQREALLQNSPDGVNREQGIWYHHEVLDMMLIAALVARPCGIAFEPAYWQRIESMLEFIASIMDSGGNVPAFGDSDDAMIVRFCPDAGFPVFRSQLAAGAVLFGRGDFKAKAGAFDDKSRWLLGDQAESKFNALPQGVPTNLPRRKFPEGGYYVLGANFESPREIRIIVDAGPLGYLSIAAHGHADALSFTLSVAGQEILCDPGTYSYHTDRKWRHYFRGTSAHNTLRIDGQDQSESGGSFMWTTHAAARCVSVDLSGRQQRLVVSHDGYRRLKDPVNHIREFSFFPSERTLRITDRIIAAGAHRLEMFAHFTEACKVTMHADHASISTDKVSLKMYWPKDTVARLHVGVNHPPLGWISRQFDVKEACPAIAISSDIHGDWSGVTTIECEPTGDGSHDQ